MLRGKGSPEKTRRSQKISDAQNLSGTISLKRITQVLEEPQLLIYRRIEHSAKLILDEASE